MKQKFENYFDIFFINQKYQFDEQSNNLDDTNSKEIIIINPSFMSNLGYLNLEPSSNKETISFAKASILENNNLHHTDFIINSKLGNYGFIYNQFFIEHFFNPNHFPSEEALMNLPIQLSSNIIDEIIVIRIKKLETNNSKIKFTKSLNSGKIDYIFKLITLEALADKILKIIKNKYINNSKKKLLISNLEFEQPPVLEQLQIIENAQSIAIKQLEIYKATRTFLEEKQKYFGDLLLSLKMNYEE